jgi:predicted nucleic acid-binding protein
VAKIGVIQQAQVSDTTPAVAIATTAEGGEAEVIALALENRINLVLMDDYRGRKVAQRLGLKTRGILGHLLLLKQLGHIDTVRDYLERLTERGFFLSERIVYEVLYRLRARGSDFSTLSSSSLGTAQAWSTVATLGGTHSQPRLPTTLNTTTATSGG